MKPIVYVIGYNSQERVDRAMASIPNKYDKILIDNGSHELSHMGVVTYIRTGPAYFTSAFNFAVTHAMEHGAIPIICNDDIVLEDGCIDAIVAEIEDGAGIVCPMQVDMAVPDRVIMGGTGPAYPAGKHLTGARAGFSGKADFPWLPFCVVGLNPRMVEEIGLLDHNLQMWFSDSDYAIRARLAGWRCMLLKDTAVRHEQSATVGEVRRERCAELDRIFVLDQAHFTRKWGGGILKEYS